jgi:peptidoglycan/LPS O-acetylase OafA/YrhL
MVIYAHAFALGGFGYDPLYRWSGDVFSTGAIAVDGFFLLSGFLITSSYLRLKSLPQFLWHRALRIFPGYWACLVVTAIGLPLLWGRYPQLGYIKSNFWLIQQQTALTGLLATNPLPNQVNGSLWTLGHEFRAYLIVGLLGCFGLLTRRFIFGLLLLAWLAYVATYYTDQPLMVIVVFKFLSHFFAGGMFYLWQPRLNSLFACVSLVVAGGTLVSNLYPLVSPVTTGYLLLWLAIALPCSGFGRVRDYSYGFYIYAFPVQQTLTAYGFNRWGYFSYFLFSIVCTLPLAGLSWHLIEKPFLRLKQWHPKIEKLKVGI